MANILAGPLMELAPAFATHLSAGAWVGLSGLLREQAAQVSGRYRSWFDMRQPVYRESWCLLTGQRLAQDAP